MADAVKAIAKTVKEEGGYQNDTADKGNFHKGVNYGTKFGITPGAWLAYYKKDLQPDTIKKLTVDQAVPIYKQNYWDKIRGDEIENDSIAELMFFTVVNSGTGQTLTFRKLINRVAGTKLVTEETGPLTAGNVHVLNTLDPEKFFNALKAERERFYRALVDRRPELGKYLKGWLNRLNGYKFSGGKKKVVAFSAALVLLILILVWFFLLRR
jgi:lysozyme family protein